MWYRKKNVPVILILWLLGISVSSTATADSATQDTKGYFKGPTSSCLAQASVVYPCISLSPPAYQTNFGTGIIAAVRGPELPLDSGAAKLNWLDRLKEVDYWNPKWHLSRPVWDAEVESSQWRSGALMKMDIGPLKFDVFADDANFSESRFFLGIDRTW